MSDLKAILDATKRIESILEQQCGGHGRGMHEKLSNVQVPLPEHVVKRVRYIASVRNKVVHEAGYDIEDMPAFLDTCTRTADALERIAASTTPAQRAVQRTRNGWRGSRWLWWALVLGFFWVCLQMPQFWRTLMPSATSNSPPAPQVATPETPKALPPPTAAASQAATPAETRTVTVPEPSRKPTPAALPVASQAAPAKATEAAATDSTSAQSAFAKAPVQLSNLSLQYRKGSFDRQEAHITVTVHNKTDATMASLRLHARLFLNAQAQPVLDTASQRRASPLFAYLGEQGLRAGEKRKLRITVGHMGDDNWRTPDVLNATSRRLELAVQSYTDGLNQTVTAPGLYVSTKAEAAPHVATRSATDVDVDAEAKLKADKGRLEISQPRIQYAKGAFNRTEPRIQVTLHNNTGRTIANAYLAGRLYLDGSTHPALNTVEQRGTDAFFAYLGETGLQAGQSRTITLHTSHLSHAAWYAPDAINAQSRRLELAVLRYTDGRGEPVTIQATPKASDWR